MLSILRFSLTLILCGAAAYAQTPLKFDRYSVVDGLSQSQVFDIAQDDEGFMWFATADGLNRFDGVRFIVHRSTDAQAFLEDDYILCLLWENRNVLWIGTDGGGLHRVEFTPDGARKRVFRFDALDSNSLSHNRVLKLVRGRDEVLWIATNDGLNRIHLKTLDVRRVGLASENKSTYVTSIIEDHRGTLWLGTPAGLIRLNLRDGSTRIFGIHGDDRNALRDEYVLSLAEDHRHRIWVGTARGGLYRFSEVDALPQFHHIGTTAKTPGGLSDDAIWSIQATRNGDLWVGTGNGGLNRLVDESSGIPLFEHFLSQEDDPYSISSNEIRSIFEDRDGNVWIGTGLGGVSKVHPRRGANRFPHYRIRVEGEPTSVNFIWSMAVDEFDRVWLGTRQHGLLLVHQGSSAIKVATDRVSPFVWSLFRDSRRRLWVGSHRRAVQFTRPTRAGAPEFDELFLDPKNLDRIAQPTVSAMTEDKEGGLWFATWGDGVYRRMAGQKPEHVLTADQIGNAGLVVCIQASQSGLILIGTDGDGFLIYDPLTSQIQRYLNVPSDSTSLSNNRVYSVLEDQKGRYWIGTYGSGICRFNPLDQKFKRWTVAQGLSNNSVNALKEDASGRIWVMTNRGISVVDPADESMRRYTVADGLQSMEFTSASTIDGTGRMLLGGINGFNRFHPDSIREGSYHSPVAITGWRIQNRDGTPPLLLNGELSVTIEYPENQIRIDFGALDYFDPQGVTYATKMEGLDAEWIHAGSSGQARYTNLGGGTYVFRVRAANAQGVWSTHEASMTIVVKPPFWKTWAFGLTTGTLLLLGTIGAVRFRIQGIERQRRRLESVVKERTAELTKTLDELRATQLQLVQSEKLSSLGIMVAGIAHEINNPLAFVYGNLTHLSDYLRSVTRLVDDLEAELREKGGDEIAETLRRIKNKNDYDFVVNDLNKLLRSTQGGANRIKKIVEDLRQFATADETDRVETDLHEDLESALTYLKPELSDEIRVVRQYGPIPRIVVYRGLLNQVFFGILQNAIQSIQRSGEIRIQTRTLAYDFHALRPDAALEPNAVCVTIIDSGTGMDETVKQRLFDPFFTTKSVGKGTGLGLSIAYGIVRKHNGHIEFETEMNKGSTFRVILPMEGQVV